MARHVLAWEVVALAAASSPPALSESTVRVAHAFLSGHPRPGRAQRGRPASSWWAAGHRVRVASEWRERRHGAPPAGGSLPRPEQICAAGRYEHHQPIPRPEKVAFGRWCGNTRGTGVACVARCGGKAARGGGEDGTPRSGSVPRWGAKRVCRGPFAILNCFKPLLQQQSSAQLTCSLAES